MLSTPILHILIKYKEINILYFIKNTCFQKNIWWFNAHPVTFILFRTHKLWLVIRPFQRTPNSGSKVIKYSNKRDVQLLHKMKYIIHPSVNPPPPPVQEHSSNMYVGGGGGASSSFSPFYKPTFIPSQLYCYRHGLNEIFLDQSISLLILILLNRFLLNNNYSLIYNIFYFNSSYQSSFLYYFLSFNSCNVSKGQPLSVPVLL